MYDGDKQQKMKEDIEAIFGVYIINPPHRHKDEKVFLKQDRRGNKTVELRVFFDQRRAAPRRVECFAYRWLLFGRFGQGGSRTLFSRYPKVRNADIIFYTLTSKRSVAKDGKYTVVKTPKPYLRARVSRLRAKRLDWDTLEKSMSINGTKCAVAGKKAVNSARSQPYLEDKNRDP